MKKTDFIEELIDILELEENDVNENTSISLDSLAIMSIIAFIDENFDMQVKADELKSISRIQGLIDVIGQNKIS